MADEVAVARALNLLSVVRGRSALGTTVTRLRSQKHIDRLPEQLGILIEDGMAIDRQQEALEKLCDLVASVDAADEKLLHHAIDENGLMVAVVMFLEATPITRERLLVAGLVLLANTAVIAGGPALVYEAGGALLLPRSRSC